MSLEVAHFASEPFGVSTIAVIPALLSSDAGRYEGGGVGLRLLTVGAVGGGAGAAWVGGWGAVGQAAGGGGEACFG